MHIISTQTFVAGIFAQQADAQHYLTLKPPGIESFVHADIDLAYPFFLLETGDGRFVGLQTDAEARAHGGGIIIYTIYEDYQPEHPWTDFMGALDHDHLLDC